MAQLRQDYEKFVKLDTEIIVAGPEKAEAFKDYWAKENLPFIGLPDPEHKVLKLYGQEIKIFKLGRMPAQILLINPARFVLFITVIQCRIFQRIRSFWI